MIDMDKFLKLVPKLSKNPLGIIALFIVLIYGFAALVVGVSGENLKPDQKQPIIWFLVIFPVIVLFVFVWLVTKHHTKLYSPADFKDESHFVELQDQEGQSILQDYTNTLRAQLEGAKIQISQLDKQGAEKSVQLKEVKDAFMSLSRDYETLRKASEIKARPAYTTIVSSVTSSDALATSTESDPPITKDYLLEVLSKST